MSFPPADHPGRHTSDLCKFWNVSCDNSSRADDSSTANRYSRQNDSVHADVCPSADTDRNDLQVSLNEWNVGWQSCVLRPQHFRARAPSDVILDD